MYQHSIPYKYIPVQRTVHSADSAGSVSAKMDLVVAVQYSTCEPGLESRFERPTFYARDFAEQGLAASGDMHLTFVRAKGTVLKSLESY